MSSLAIIPAKSESKRCPGKNRRFIERPLAAARDSGLFDPVLISTENWDVLNLPDSVLVLHRPRYLVADDVNLVAVARYHANQFRPDFVCVIQATSVFITADDLIRSSALLKDAEVVLSVGEFEACPGLRPGVGHVAATGGFVWATREYVMRARDWYETTPALYLLPPERALDIDTPEDMRRVERVLERLGACPGRGPGG